MAPNGPEQNQTAISRRPAILMGLLLVLLGGFLYWQHASNAPTVGRRVPPPVHLKGKNSVSRLVVKQGKGGTWIAEFDYFYTGDPQYARAEILADTPSSGFGTERAVHTETALPAQLGAHHARAPVGYGGDSVTTTGVTVRLASFIQPANHGTLASQRVEQVIHWPDLYTWLHDQQTTKNTPEQNLARAIGLIDSGDDRELTEAGSLLQRLLEENPKLDAAYVELARVAMKSNWSAEGLHQAESLLGSALKIRPDSADAKILLGYVYANQRQFAKAEATFASAAASNPRNLWLWPNWGELLEMEGKKDQAIAKYREAIDRPMTHDSSDHAREQAYFHLLKLFQDRNDIDGMEALYKQRAAEPAPGACHVTDYAQFILQARGDTQSAIDLARGELNQSCDSAAREILGLADYVKWATTRGPEADEALNQARVFVPPGAKLIYLLSRSERTIPAVRHLIADSEKIDEKDSSNLTALAHALQEHDYPAAKRLLALGADPTTTVGSGDLPVALMPVMEEDLQGIRFLRKSGVDYSKLRYRGLTALEVAKRAGNNTVLEALGGGGSAL